MKVDIDVVISLYNKEHEIRKTILSIINQKIRPSSIIIVNNNSTDNSLLEVERVVREYSHIDVQVINEPLQGAQYARYAGAMHSKARYVSFLDGDDYLKDNHFEVLNSLIKSYSDFDVYCTSYVHEYANKLLKAKNIDEIIISTGKRDFFKYYLFNRSMICSSNICCKRSLIDREWIESKDRIGEDLNVWFSIIAETKFICTDVATVVINKAPVSVNSSSIQKEVISEIFSKNLDKMSKTNIFYEKLVFARRIIYVGKLSGIFYLRSSCVFLVTTIAFEFYRILRLNLKICGIKF